MKVNIELEGCDDYNEFEIEVTEEELTFLKKLSELSHICSKSSCQPKLNIEEKN